MYNVVKQCRHGLMVYNRNDAYIGRSLELYGEFSQGESKLFEQIVRTGDVVIEVGANIGAHTVRLAQLAGSAGRVHAFEPQRLVFQMGMEIDVLLGGRELILRTRPVLYVENDRPARSETLVGYLRSLGYELYWHTPRLYNPDNYSGNHENVFGGTLSINLFGIPSGSGVHTNGFARVESPVHPVFKHFEWGARLDGTHSRDA